MFLCPASRWQEKEVSIKIRVRTGDTLDVAAPGHLHLAVGDAPVLLLSAGIGATPVLAILHSLAAEGATRAG